MNLKKIGAIMMSAAVAVSASGITTLAATQNYANGTYTGYTEVWNGSKHSMSNGLFNYYAEIEVTDSNTNLTLRCFSPVLNAPALSDASIAYEGETYEAVITDGEGIMNAIDGFPMGGIEQGVDYGFQELDFSLPADAIDTFEEGFQMNATVTAMGQTMTMPVTIKDITPTGTTEPEGDSQDMEITATVEEKVSEPSYTVILPSGSTSLGELSADKDNSVSYNINVKASGLDGTISVSAPATGLLTSGDNTLAFANSFGTQTVTGDTEGTDLSGTISIKAADIAAAAAGNYTGTTTFTISYAAN